MKSICGLSALGLTLLDLAAATASPKVLGMNFERNVRKSTGATNRLRKRQSKTVGVDIDNADIAYVINMTLGSPPQQFTVQLDTGSADIWVPAVDSDVCSSGPDVCSAGAFDSSSSTSFHDNVIDQKFSITYQDGSGVEGTYINETLTMGQGVTIKEMTLGLAETASRAIGIMGIGFSADESLATDDSTDTYPNIVNQLKDNDYISTLAYSLWLNDLDSDTGSILFGGIDTAKFHGPLTVLPIQKNPQGVYTDFTVVMSSLSLVDGTGKSQYSQNNIALPVILDSGTTATYVPDDIAQSILQGVGAINDDELGYIVPCSLSNSPDVFTFGFGGNGGPAVNISFGEFVMPLFDDNGNTYQFRGSGEAVCGWGMLSSGPQGPDQPILLGDTFLRSAYVVYNLANNEIGLAQTNFNTTDSNVVAITDKSIPSAASTATAAAATVSYTGHPLEQGHTRTASGAAFTGNPLTPTFNLGVAGPSSTGGKKNAAPATMAPPRGLGVMTIVTGGVVMMSMLLGGSMMVFVQ